MPRKSGASAIRTLVCMLLAAAAAPSHAFLAAGGLGPPARLRAGVQPLAMSETTRVLVTGANKGIGRAICEKLLVDYPECHVLLGSRSPERGRTAVEELVNAHPDARGRVEMLQIDTSDDASVASAAAAVCDKFGTDPAPLHGIINNAGIGFRNTLSDTLQTNAYGPYRVTNAFLPLIRAEGGRIVNIASASGPMFVAGVSGEWLRVLTDPEVQWEEIEKTMEEALNGAFEGEAYGFSKACLNAYTQYLAQQHPNLVINSCTPGFIATDLTKGMGASGTPAKGAVVPVELMMGERKGPGFYFGSDGLRSPLDRYRGPGDPEYVP